MFCNCLILHILSSKYFAETFGAFFIFPSNTGTNFAPFDCLRSPWCNFSCKFSIFGLNFGLKFPCKVPGLYLS